MKPYICPIHGEVRPASDYVDIPFVKSKAQLAAEVMIALLEGEIIYCQQPDQHVCYRCSNTEDITLKAMLSGSSLYYYHVCKEHLDEGVNLSSFETIL